MYMKMKDLMQEERDRLLAAMNSRTFDEYVFRCEVLDLKPMSEYGVNHYGHCMRRMKDGTFLLIEIQDCPRSA